MAFVLKDRVKEITTTTGTGAVSLGGSSATFDQFQSYLTNGDTTYYAIAHTATGVDEWEVGLGTWNTGNTLSRTTVLAGSNGTSAVNFSAGTKDIFMSYPASKAIYKDADGKVDITPTAIDDTVIGGTTAAAGSFTNLDASGEIDVGTHIDFAVQSAHASYAEGRLWYDNIHKTLNFYSDNQNVIHEIGLEEHQRVFNNSGSTIGKGKPLYFAGNYTAGSIDVPTVGLADATDVNAYNAQGLAAADIPNNSYGYCIIAGQLDGLDTSGLTAGTNFFVGLTPGAVQNASPTYPNYPMCLGWVVNSDATNGVLLVNQQNHSVRSFRVQTDAHIGSDLIVGGNLSVLGTTTTTSTSDVTAGAPFYRANEGDAIGESGTTFTGTGLDDAFFSGHFTGTTATTYYVKIDGTGTPDTFSVSIDNFATTISTGTAITGSEQLIHSADNIYVKFGATTGHTLNDVWTGTASPILVDTGFFSNRNTGTSGVGYTHMGFFYDVSTDKWTLLDEYDPTPAGTINLSDSSVSYGTLKLDSVEGSVTGNVTGDVSGNATTATTLATARNIGGVSFDGSSDISLPGVNSTGNQDTTGNAATATALETARTIQLSGDVTGSVSFDGTGDVNITSTVVDDSHAHVISNVDGLQTALDGKVATSFTITSGNGLTGGGDLTANRTLAVGAGTGITVNADDIAIGQDVATTASVQFGAIDIGTIGTSGVKPLRVKSDTSHHAIHIEENSGTEGYTLGVNADGDFGIYNSQQATASVVVDDSGNFLVGTTDDVVSDTSGSGFSYQASSGYLALSRDTASDIAAVMYLNRTGDDGQHLQFRKDGTTVGLIGVNNGDNLYVGAAASGHAGFYFGNLNVAPMAAGTRVDGSVNLGSTTYRWQDLYLSGNAYIGGNTVWHAGNDGSGSGLDADTLDGIQGSSYLRSDTADVGTTLTLSKVILTNTEGDSSGTTGGTVIYDANFFSDAEYASAGATFASDGGGLAIYGENGWGRVLDSANMQFATLKPANVTISGNNVWHAGNDGSGSGLDADTLDGVQASQFLRSDTNDSFTGATLSLTGSTGEKIILSGSSSPYIRFREGTTNKAYVQWNSGGYLYLRNTEDSSGLRIKDNLDFSQDGTTFYTVWHAGNLATGAQYVDTATGNYGTVKVDDDRGVTWAGYAIRDDWVFMSNGADEAGIYNDTDNEWGIKFFRNSTTRLYNNGSEKLRTLSGGVGVTGLTVGDVDANPHNAGCLQISNSNDEKIVLSGSSNPYIRWQEGTTDKAYIQWNGGGWLDFRNQENGQFRFQSTTTTAATIYLVRNDTSTTSGEHLGEIAFSHTDGSYDPPYNSSSQYASARIVAEATETMGSGDDGARFDFWVKPTNTNKNSTSSMRFRMDQNGNFHADGNIYAYSTTTSSDERLKKDIQKIDGALDKVKELSGYTFKFKKNDMASGGVIAQEVEKVFPVAVEDTESEALYEEGEVFKTVNYNALHGLLIEAIKEQQAQIDKLKEQLEKCKC